MPFSMADKLWLVAERVFTITRKLKPGAVNAIVWNNVRRAHQSFVTV